MHAITVAHPIHMVISADSHSNQSPGCDRLCWTYRKGLARLFSVYHPFARLRKQDDALGMRSSVVFHFFHKKRQRINIIPCCRLNHIQMQMRAERISRIPAKGYHLPCLYRIFSRFGNDLHFPTLLFILQFFHSPGHIACKSTEVAVDSGITVIIIHIKHIP